MKFTSFETARLLLQPTSMQDAGLIFELFNTPKWLKYIGDRQVTSTEKAKAYIEEKMLPQLDRLGFGAYTVIKKLDKKKIGICGLYDREGLVGIDLGFAFLPEFEKKGYAFEASYRLKKAAFNEFELDRILAITTKDNTDSQRLLEKLGFKKLGVKKLPNEKEELLTYQVEK